MIPSKVQLQSLDRTVLIQIIEKMASGIAELLAERNAFTDPIFELPRD